MKDLLVPTIPAGFQLVAAMNPCPCGKLGARGGAESKCECSLHSIQGYLRKLSGPILDRIDMHIELEPVPISELLRSQDTENGEENLRDLVLQTQEFQLQRYGKASSRLELSEIRQQNLVSEDALVILKKAAKIKGVSARAFTRVLRVARTIADIEEQDTAQPKHVAEALSFRGIEKLEQYARAGS